MKKNRWIIVILSILFLLFLVPNTEAFASGSQDEKATHYLKRIKRLDKMITVYHPGFDVSINGVVISDKRPFHPIICYNDIVYIPLDWVYCNWLGIDISLGENDEIIIDHSGKENSFVTWHGAWGEGVIPNRDRRETDGMISNKVMVNGREIDNASETYPLLQYYDHEVYFPLTWEWIVNEFGWCHDWDAQTGLTIHTNGKNKTPDILLQTKILSEINDFTYNKSAYVKADVKSVQANESQQMDLKKRTSGIQDHLNRSTDQLITESYTTLYFEGPPAADNNNKNTAVDENKKSTIPDENNRNTIIIEGANGVCYEISGYYYRHVMEHDYTGKVWDIGVYGKSYLEDIDMIALRRNKDGTTSDDDKIYQSLKDAGYLHERTPEYNVCDNFLKFEFLSGRNKVLSFEETTLSGFDEAYRIEYETFDRNYLNPEVDEWDEDTYIDQPKVFTKKTAVIAFEEGEIARIIINDGLFEYDMRIDVVDF